MSKLKEERVVAERFFCCTRVRGAPTARDWIEPNYFLPSVRDVDLTTPKTITGEKRVNK